MKKCTKCGICSEDMGLEVGADCIFDIPETVTYYSLYRPISIGTYPKAGLIDFENFDSKQYVDSIHRTAWGVLRYDRELTDEEQNTYELRKERI